MANPSKQKGTRNEGEVLRWLIGITGNEDLHREVLHGSKDVGDIGGLKDRDGRPIVIEVKSGKPAFKQWLRELDNERANAGARWAFIVWRTDGTTNPDEWIVMTNDLTAWIPGPGPAHMLAKYVRIAREWMRPMVGFRCDGQVPLCSVDCDAVAMTGTTFEYWLQTQVAS